MSASFEWKTAGVTIVGLLSLAGCAEMPTGPTVTVMPVVAVWPIESLTCTMKLKTPAVVGVPEMRPLELSVRPSGGDPTVRPK